MFAVQVAQTPINGDPIHAFVDDDKIIARHLSQARKFGDDSGKMLFVAADDGRQLFTATKLNAIRSAKNEILAIPEIRTVTSFVDAYRSREPGAQKNIRTIAQQSVARRKIKQGEVPEIRWKLNRYWPESKTEQSKISFRQLKRDTLSDPLLKGTLVSSDGNKHAYLIAIDPDRQLSIPRQKSLWREIETILKDNNVGSNGIHVAGLPVTNAAIGQEIENAFIMFLPIGFLTVATFVFLIYRDWRITFLNLLIGVIAVIWSLGLTSLVFGEITILVAAAPLIVLSVSTTDFLHITTAYQLALQKEPDKQRALTKVMTSVGGACVLTSLTTFVGFASLTLTRSVAVKQFGFSTAIGVSVALIMMVTLLPLVYRKIRAIQSPVETRTYRAVDRIVHFCSWSSQKYPLAIFLFSLMLCVPGVMLIAQKPIDADIAGRFPDDHKIQTGLNILESDFYGSNSIEFFVAPENDQSLFDPEFINNLKLFAEEVSRRPQILKVISILDLYNAIDIAIGYRTENRLPADPISAQTSIEWVKQVEASFVQSLIADDGMELRIRVMVQSDGFRANNVLGLELKKNLEQQLGNSFDVEMGGTNPIIGNVLDNVIYSQVAGFFVCVICLTVIMIWGLGSWRVGILAQIPNLIPVLLMVSLIALFLDQLDSDLLGLPMIALGIAVDDTIHFLHRYRNPDLEENESRIDAVFRTTGRSIVISTLALCVGLFPLAFAQIISLWMIGTFLVAGIFGALISDLFCLPAMIKLGLIRY